MTKAAVWIILVGLLGHGSSLFLEEDCGVTYEVVAKINHGKAAGILQNPWMALIKTQEDFICGGTIITKRFVMTAAHCLCETQDCNTKRTGLIARLGEYNRSSEIDFAHTYEDFPVEQYYEHKGFRMKNHLNDIALLKLQGTIEYKRQIRPICILVDSRKKSDVDRIPIFTAVGWGYTEKGNLSDVLQTVNINRIPKTDCNNIFWGNMGDTQICGGTGTGKDTCKGDSGGPLYSNALYGDTWRRTQLGIISYGADKCGGIGVYTDVMSFVDFIVQTVMEHDITVLVPKIELLDAGCLDGKSPSGAATFPWLAEIYLDSFLINYGTLITDRFLLTTAQLVPSDGPLQVRLGGDKVAYKVKAVHKHPDFVSLSENDIAVIELEHKVNYTAKIKPICLPSLTNKVEQEKFQERANLAKNLRVVGWGRKTSTLVQRVDSNKCYKVDHQEIGSKQICVSHPNSNTLNVGSGSPLIMPLDHGKSKAFTLVGLASFGRREFVSQDVYTNVLSYLDWIGTLVKQ